MKHLPGFEESRLLAGIACVPAEVGERLRKRIDVAAPIGT
jgi:hypothetical protein